MYTESITREELIALFHALPRKGNKRYIITWAWGTRETFWGNNYIHALYANGITPKMQKDIVAHEEVNESN